MMSDIRSFLPRCLSSRGVCFAIEFQRICCVVESFNLIISCAWEVAGAPKRRITSFLDASYLAVCGMSLWRWLDIDFVPSGTIGEPFDQFVHLASMLRSSHLFFKVIWLAFVWESRKREITTS